MIYPRELSSTYPDSDTGKPGWAPETAWPDSWVLTGAMAAVTSRLRFSNAVYIAPARPLLEVAKAGRHRLRHLRRSRDRSRSAWDGCARSTS